MDCRSLVWTSGYVISATAVILAALHAQPAPPGAPLACGGGVTVLLDGKPLATGCVLNIKAGYGVLATPAANPAIGGTDLSFAVDSAVMLTPMQQLANPNYCDDSSGTAALTCTLRGGPAPSTLQAGFVVDVMPHASAASATLTISNVTSPAISIKQNCAADMSKAVDYPIVDGAPFHALYNGSVFCKQ